MTEHSYTTPEEVRDYLDRTGNAATSSSSNERLAFPIATATDVIDKFCGRVFTLTTEEARVFPVEVYDSTGAASYMAIDDVTVDDVSSVVIEHADTPSDTWAPYTGKWWLGPLPKLEGWPYTFLYLRTPRQLTGRYVRLTTDWGWADEPAPASVNRACTMLASRYFLRGSSPLGQENVNAEFGTVFVRRVDPDIQHMLRPYKREHLVAW